MAGNLFLFTGENTYALREERRRWVAEFVKKHGEENLSRMEGQRLPMRQLLDEVSVMPFLSTKRLVIIEGVPRWEKEEVQLLATSIHPAVLVLLVEPALDKRTSAAKELLKLADVKEFTPLQGAPLTQWMQDFVASQGATLAREALPMLLDLVGENQDMLSQELSKLSLAAGGKQITPLLVEQMVVPSAEDVIWKLTDLLTSKRKKEAMAFSRRLLERGGDPYGMWAILLNMWKNAVGVFAAAKAGQRDMKTIAQQLGVHFMAVRSLLPYSSKLTEQSVEEFLHWVTASDIGLKTGGYRATDEAPQEILALIDEFLMKCPG